MEHVVRRTSIKEPFFSFLAADLQYGFLLKPACGRHLGDEVQGQGNVQGGEVPARDKLVKVGTCLT